MMTIRVKNKQLERDIKDAAALHNMSMNAFCVLVLEKARDENADGLRRFRELRKETCRREGRHLEQNGS